MGDIGEYWHGVRNRGRGRREQRAWKRRKLTQTTSQPKPTRLRCYDWMIVSGNSYARNRSWFTDYRRVDGGFLDLSNGKTVFGIGTVKLKVKCAPGSEETRMVELRNVLHIPEACCNGFVPTHGVVGGWGHEFLVAKCEGCRTPLWYAEHFCGLRRLVLAEEKEGESPLRELETEHLDRISSLSMILTEVDYTSLSLDRANDSSESERASE